MRRHLTPDEVKTEILSAFPLNCGDLFFEIWTDVNNLDLSWQDYRALYGTSPERIDLLNWAAGTFFGLIENTMWHDVLLRIARLTDPPKKGRYERASLGQIVKRVSPHLDSESIKRLNDQLEALVVYCKPIRDLRDRVIAHDDLPTALHYHPEPLPGLSRADVEGALQRIHSLVNEIENHFNLAPTSFELILSVNDAETLIDLLERARKDASKILERLTR
jgi:hypothetical protein